MKKTIGKLPFLILTLAAIGCKKEGCTDIAATNYDETAKKENGSCTFEGSNVLWYGEEISTFLVNDDASSLTYYVDGKLIGSTATNVYWTSPPNCGDDASITITQDLGKVKTQSYNYSVIDQTGWVYWEGTLNFNANECITIELN